jgi:hypothetical protein
MSSDMTRRKISGASTGRIAVLRLRSLSGHWSLQNSLPGGTGTPEQQFSPWQHFSPIAQLSI